MNEPFSEKRRFPQKRSPQCRVPSQEYPYILIAAIQQEACDTNQIQTSAALIKSCSILSLISSNSSPDCVCANECAVSKSTHVHAQTRIEIHEPTHIHTQIAVSHTCNPLTTMMLLLVSVRVQVYTYAYIYYMSNICMYVYTCMYIYSYVDIYVCVYMYIYIYI